MPTNHPIPKVVKLDPEIRDRLERLGEIKHRSAHWLMKEAITRYLEQEEYNEQLNRETLARWQEAEQGKVVSHRAVSKWLDTWGTDEESDRPPCGK
jgi:predicted transcriptional regulator